jgi:alkanesulfonate monooxygenase SsuD/methylene tetrahydromethanopterin reductase-like flavin-dependent oxidoreductase (luciferase family)
MGLPYAFADFIAPGGAAVAQRYRQTFTPSANLPMPRVIVAAWALCADTDAEAERLASSSRMAFAHFLNGNPIPVPAVETALRFFEGNDALLDTVVHRRRAIVGSPPRVRAQLESLAREYGAEEVMVVTITHEHAARRRSYELLAAEFGLAGT